MAQSTLETFRKFLCYNLLNAIDNEILLVQLYNSYCQEEWKDDDALKDPMNLRPHSLRFLDIVDQADKTQYQWWKTSREFGLSDTHLARCIDIFEGKYMSIPLPNGFSANLAVLKYVQRINKGQLAQKLPNKHPTICTQTVRLMRELYLIDRNRYNNYKIRSDDEQIKQILTEWFHTNYIAAEKHNTRIVGYSRRKLLEEANTFLTKHFGQDERILYVHDPAWQHLLHEIIKVPEQCNKNYARLPVHKKNGEDNVRHEGSNGGNYTLTERLKQRLGQREPTAKEKDCLRKAEKKRKRK